MITSCGAPRIWQRGSYAVFALKTLILAHFFIEKGMQCVHCVVTTDNTKIFSQLMSKSRSLAKINERRLQPLLV